MTNRIVPALAAVAVVALAGCAPVWAAPLASGPRVSDDRSIESVEAVEIRTDGDLTVTVGDTPSLTISAPQGVMGRLTSDVVDGVLVLGTTAPHWGWGLGEIRYELTVPKLSAVSIKGSSEVDADFSGADDVRISIDGSADFGGADLVSRTVRVSISGSGDVEVHATETLDAEISGSGSVRYRGGASVTSDVSGSGSVSED